LASFAKQLLANFYQFLASFAKLANADALGADPCARCALAQEKGPDTKPRQRLAFFIKHLPCLKEENATEKRKGGRLAAER